MEVATGLDGAGTSLAVAAVVSAQRAGEIAAWLQLQHGSLFPPDLESAGVDLDGLVVVHVPPRGVAVPTAAKSPAAARAAHELPKAAELLLRSGAFDLLVLDLRSGAPPRGAWAGRLRALAREHQSRVLLLTDARTPADLGTAIAQRIAPRRRRQEGTFALELQLLVDRMPAPGRVATLLRSGPAGLH
ncbi:MAG: hypothetical protein WAT39_25945 [Planctomycetota bacterium]